MFIGFPRSQFEWLLLSRHLFSFPPPLSHCSFTRSFLLLPNSFYQAQYNCQARQCKRQQPSSTSPLPPPISAAVPSPCAAPTRRRPWRIHLSSAPRSCCRGRSLSSGLLVRLPVSTVVPPLLLASGGTSL